MRPVIRDDASTVQDERKTYRSQEIDVNSFHEKPVSSERTERPVIETSVIQARSSEDSKDPNFEKAHQRTKRLVVETNTENVPDSSQTRAVHEGETFNVGDETIRERTVRPIIDHDNLSHEKIMVNEADMDFRIPGLPHSVVKHTQSTNVRELIQKIENHPDRHALQQDLRQNQACNPFNPESEKMIQDVGNIELCELLETELQNAVRSMPIILENRHRLLHMRAILAERNSGQSKIRSIYDGPSFSPRVCHQEGKSSWTQIWEKAMR